jgi:hypothetical protein
VGEDGVGGNEMTIMEEENIKKNMMKWQGVRERGEQKETMLEEDNVTKNDMKGQGEKRYVGLLISLWLFLFPVFLFAAQPKEFFLDGLKKLE